MKFSEKIIIPLIVIATITALGCYYILKDYNKKQFEIKKGTTADEIESSEDSLTSDGQMKYEGVGILVGTNLEEKLLTFEAIDATKKIELQYDSNTRILSKHDSPMTVDQLRIGDVLDITYSIHSNTIDSLKYSQTAWNQTDITRFEIDQNLNTIKIGDTLYRLSENVVVTNGKSVSDLIDVTSVDTLTVYGVNRQVCSIIVEKGHGYLRLDNDSYFVGGWIEIGQEIIKPITERMLIPVPEGKYHVRVTNRGYAGDDDITIARDKETIVDLSKVDIQEVSIGHVLFDIKPNYAQLFVDDEMTDYVDRVPLEYGIHKVHVELVGYESVDTNIKVTSDYADVSITLDKDSTNIISGDDTSSSSTGFLPIFANTSPANTTSSSMAASTTSTTAYATTAKPNSSTVTTYIYVNGNSSSSTSSSSSSSMIDSVENTSSSSMGDSTSSSSEADTSSSSTDSSSSSSMDSSASSSEYSTSSSSTSSSMPVITDGNQLFIDNPVDTQVYIDGVYVGIAPLSCNKPVGTHIIVLYKDGYVPKSYTIELSDDGRDVTYSFSELTNGSN